MKIVISFLIAILLTVPVFAEESLKDVPKDHWAAESVQKLVDAGVIKGYPDKTFKGDQFVIRYELAAALEQFIEVIQQSWKPLVPPGTESSSSKTNINSDKTNKQPMAFLKDGGFLPADSPLLKDGDKPVSSTELAQALSSVASRLIELKVPPPDRKSD